MKCNLWYIPIIIALAFGYLAGGYLSFGVMYLGAIPCITNEDARFVMMIFGVGMLGGTTLCSKFWADDMNSVFYLGKKNYQPNAFDSFGYLSMIIEGGITGLILFFLVKTGLVIITNGIDLEINLPATFIIAYCGGLFHFEVIDKLSKYAKERLKK
jgi:uncharacterized protein YneF (UPF0154 family)